MTNTDFISKIAKIREVMSRRQLSGILINNQNNFSWLTGGRGFIGIVTEKSICSILVTPDKVYFITDNIEAQRLKDEEIGDIQAEFLVYPWYEGFRKVDYIKEIMKNDALLDDDALPGEFLTLRTILTENELEKYRWLGMTTAKINEAAARELKQGMTEAEAAGMLAGEAFKNGIQPANILVGFDERIYKYRHPLPTENRLKNYAMLVTSFRKWGMFVCCTRFVSFSKPDEELVRKFKAVTRVEAAMVLSTRPGVKVGDIFKTGMQVYKDTGFEGEWKLHHQGGLTAYAGREYRAVESTGDVVWLNQVYGWNPTITGTKVEDGIIIGRDKNEIVTHTGEYEYLETEYNGIKMQRPWILSM